MYMYIYIRVHVLQQHLYYMRLDTYVLRSGGHEDFSICDCICINQPLDAFYISTALCNDFQANSFSFLIKPKVMGIIRN